MLCSLRSKALTALAALALLVVTAAPSVAEAAPKRPAVGDDPVEITMYLQELDDRAKDLKEQLKDARREQDWDRAAGLEAEYVEARQLYKKESGRLTSTDRGLVAGGATLVGIGGVSLLTSLGLALAFAGTDDEAFGWAALATLGGGVIGVSAGGPMLSIGLEKRVRQVSWRPTQDPFGVSGASVTLSWSF